MPGDSGTFGWSLSGRPVLFDDARFCAPSDSRHAKGDGLFNHLGPRSKSVRFLTLGFSLLACAGMALARDVAVGSVKLTAEGAGAVRAALDGGARLVHNYGSFSLLEASPGLAARLAQGPHANRIALRPDFDELALRRGTINTAAARAALPDAGRRLAVVQFIGPSSKDGLSALLATGAAVVEHVPQNAVVVWTADDAVLAAVLGLRGSIAQHVGAWDEPMVLAPELDGALDSPVLVAVTVQVVTAEPRGAGDRAEATIEAVLAAAGAEVIEPPADGARGLTRNVSVRVPGNALRRLAALDRVINIEGYAEPVQQSERQAQAVAGNLNAGGTGPSGPGYFDWLASRGVPTTPESFPVVTVVDGGLDVGTTAPIDPSLYVAGLNTNPSRILFVGNVTSDPLADDAGGHGHINASIVGGFDVGLAGLDTSNGAPLPGYLRGLGVNPYSRQGHYKIFKNNRAFDLSGVGNSDAALVNAYFLEGTQVSTNSWGTSLGGQYNARAQNYDALTRDASSTTPGNQALLFVFSNGNSGPGLQSVATPASGKNVLAVGATEDSDADGFDGCSVSGTDADNIQQMAPFSSRGPVRDGRIKPDIVAPGTHISGTASRSPLYTGIGVCDAYWPTSQGTYARSSGTSHAAPAVAGLASLSWEFLTRTMGIAAPSPALLKAHLMSAARYLGQTGGDLPSNSQGFGTANGDLALSTRAPRYAFDQTLTFDQTGQTFSIAGSIINPGEPVRVMLVWTDVPGNPGVNGGLVNNLNLSVDQNGTLYKGNVFSGSASVSGGNADNLNNAEGVFINAGASGPMTINISAANIAGDGIPGVGDSTDQDFALIVYNFSGDAAALAGTGPNVVGDALGVGNGNGNGRADPGETSLQLSIPLGNFGTGMATGVSTTLVPLSAGVSVSGATASYADLGVGATGVNATPFVFALDPSFPCGTAIQFRLDCTTATTSYSYFFSVGSGLPTGLAPAAEFAYAGPSVFIPDNNATGIAVPVSVSGVSGTVGKVRLRFDGSSCSSAIGSTTVGLDHTFMGDLAIQLESPAGTVVSLSNRTGGIGNNLCQTIFDDDAVPPFSGVIDSQNPFSGTFRPAGALSAFNGQSANGTWRLRVQDLAASDFGNVRAFRVIIQTVNPAQCDAPAVVMPPCMVDFNADGFLNQEDLAGYISAFLDESVAPGPSGTSVAPCPGEPVPYDTLGYATDFNRDCSFNQEDLAGFITEYLTQTENPVGCVPG